MWFLSKRLRGSFTVEASVLLPVITFIMIGMLYYICFLHDWAQVQSYCLCAAESAVSAQQFEGMSSRSAADAGSLQEKIVMSKVSEPSVPAQSFSLLTIYRSLKSYRSACAQCSLDLQIPIAQTAVFTGEKWNRSCSMTASAVDYPADWLKYQIRQKLK